MPHQSNPPIKARAIHGSPIGSPYDAALTAGGREQR
jgi:hypothetical protein